jgi:septum formation protein
MNLQIILASASPRRQALLDQLKIRYRICPVDIDERPLAQESPSAYVTRLSAAKAVACYADFATDLPILAADTTVAVDDIILSKPIDRSHGLAMLAQLSGKTHRVYTAVSLKGAEHRQIVVVTEVTFKTLTKVERERYWDTGEPADKAGAYAIQGLGALWVSSIQGSYSNVVGLPLFETAELLAQQGIHILT